MTKGWKNQGWEFTHWLIAHLLIRSDRSNQMSNCERFAQIPQDKWATVIKSLRSLMSKEQPWANRSGRSWQMSDRERFTQVAHDKWANEQIARFFWANRSAFSLTKNERFAKKKLTKIVFFGTLAICSFPLFLMSDMSKSLRLLTKNERFTQVAYQKWATMSELTKKRANERIPNHRKN